MNAKIIIVMAAYNGGSHIQKQIDSILAQTHTNWELWIRDDGSSDHTVDVIRSCAASDPRIHLFEDSRGNLGPQESFYTLLSGCPSADYYAFCDQDDLWVPEKLEWAAEMLSQEEKRGRQKAAASGQASELSRQTAKSSEQPGTSSVPIVYVASHDYLTEDGTLLRRFPEQKTPITLYKVICHSVGSGFTMVLNDAARSRFVLDGYTSTEMHDRRLQRCAVCFGRLVYDNRIAAHHIRHDAAVTAGDSDNASLLKNWVKNELGGDALAREKAGLREFYEQYKDRLSEKDRKILSLFVSEDTSLPARMKKVFYPHRLMTRAGGEAALRLSFLLGKR